MGQTVRMDVRRDDAFRAVNPRQLHGGQADAAATGDHHCFARVHADHLHALQRHRAQVGDDRLLVADVVRNRHDFVHRRGSRVKILHGVRRAAAPCRAQARIMADFIRHDAVANLERLVAVLPRGLLADENDFSYFLIARH